MARTNLAASTHAPQHPEWTRALVQVAREWLAAQPDAAALAAHTPALELLFVAQRPSPDATSRDSLGMALARLNRDLDLPTLALTTLAALIDLNLRARHLTQTITYLDAARRLTAYALTRFDAEFSMFHADAADAPQRFQVDVNARMADTLYRAGRALEDATPSAIAGALLVNVSDAFVAGEGLYQFVVLPNGARGDAQNAAAYANAIQMFLTAGEITGRGTYSIRARVLADFILTQTWADARALTLTQRALLADALTRLYVSARVEAYQNAARGWLSDARGASLELADAPFALALERYRAAS